MSKLNIKFEGWPQIQVKLTGEKYQSTITPSIMKAFLKLQDGLYKTYALAVYADSKHRLSDEEKKQLELIIKVSQGSSHFGGDIDWGNFLTELIAKMDSKHLMITILFGLLCYFGTSGFKAFLDNRKAEKEAQSNADIVHTLAEQNKQTVEALTQIQKENNAFALEIIKQKPELQEIVNESTESKRELLKQASDADTITVQGIEITGDQAKELAKKVRKPPAREYEETRLDGMYRILNVNTELETGFKVQIRNEVNGEEYTAEVQDNTFEKQYKQAIQQATFDKKAVALNINAKRKIANGTIYDIVIIKAILESKQPTQNNNATAN